MIAVLKGITNCKDCPLCNYDYPYTYDYGERPTYTCVISGIIIAGEDDTYRLNWKDNKPDGCILQEES